MFDPNQQHNILKTFGTLTSSCAVPLGVVLTYGIKPNTIRCLLPGATKCSGEATVSPHSLILKMEQKILKGIRMFRLLIVCLWMSTNNTLKMHYLFNIILPKPWERLTLDIFLTLVSAIYGCQPTTQIYTCRIYSVYCEYYSFHWLSHSNLEPHWQNL